MDLIIGIFGKIFGVLLLLGIIGWLLDFLRAIAGLASGESFSFFIPFGFMSFKRKKRP